MAWGLLLLTVLLEVAGASFLKLSDGLTKLVPTVLLFIFYGGSFALFSIVVKKMEISLAYSIWSGLGTLFVFIIGVLIFNESFTLYKAVFILLIIIGVIGLKMTSSF